jgi:hypothetical protein
MKIFTAEFAERVLPPMGELLAGPLSRSECMGSFGSVRLAPHSAQDDSVVSFFRIRRRLFLSILAFSEPIY